MKIIHILQGKANPDTMNGVNKVVHHLATEQLRLGHEVEVWGITATPEIIRHKHDYPLRLFSATKGRFFLSNELNFAIDSIKVKHLVAHLHSVFLPELFAASRRLKKNKIPWVLSPHSGYNPNSMKKNKMAKAIYMKFFEKQLITGATRIHAIGANEVADIQRLDALADVVLIPNGQSFDEVVHSSVACNEPSERPVFGFCGRLARDHKGLDLLIKGFAHYKKSGGKGALWLIGDGPDKILLIKLAEKEGISKSIRFLGAMFGDNKLSIMKQMDVFVHTSRWEGMPTATLESAALGKPLLISEETNMGDYVRRYGNGIVLDDNTPTIIAETMAVFSQLFNAGKIQVMGDKSIKLIEDELNWPVIAEKMNHTLYSPRGELL